MTLYYYKRWKMYKNIELLKRSWQKELARSFLNTILRFPLRAKKEDCIFQSYQEASLIFSQHLTHGFLSCLSAKSYPGLWLVNTGHVTSILASDWSQPRHHRLSLAQTERWQWGNNGERDLGQSNTLPSGVQPIRGEDCEALTNQKREEESCHNWLQPRGLL